MTERRAYYCPKCLKEWQANPHNHSVAREFRHPDDPVPNCPQDSTHGKMVLQENKRYRAKGVWSPNR